MRTEDQINASRINGSKSEGATSEEGKNRCKTAALKHGLTSEFVVVAPQDQEAYDNLVSITFDYYRPYGPMEKVVIQEIANLEWKICKANAYESGLYVYGRMLNENLYKDHCPEDPRQRFVMVEGIIHQRSGPWSRSGQGCDRTSGTRGALWASRSSGRTRGSLRARGTRWSGLSGQLQKQRHRDRFGAQPGRQPRVLLIGW